MNRPLSFLRRCANSLPLRFLWESSPTTKRSNRKTLDFDVLEDRILMAGNITVNNASLFSAPITGSAGSGPDSAAILRKDDGQKLELIANYYANTVSVFQLGSNGSLTLQTTLATGSGPNGFVVGDFGNGEQDFAIANYNANTITVYLGDGQGHFTAAPDIATGSGPANEMASWTSGGKFYLATANANDGTVGVFQSTGPGTFAADGAYTVGVGAYAVTAGNFTGGGNDLAVANFNSGTVTVLQNKGDNTFTVESPISVGSNPWYIAGGDFAGTGIDSLVTANFWGNNITVIPAQGNNTFGTPQNYAVGANPTGVAVGDFNGDGKADLLVSNFSSNDVSCLAGNGDGTFQNAVSYTAGSGSGPNELAVGYVGGSGNLDALVADQNSGQGSLLLNQSLQGYVGQTFNGPLVTFTDSDASVTSPADFSATITWGDGHSSTVGASAFSVDSQGVWTLTASHVYGASGLYPGSVTITDSDSNTGGGVFSVGIHPAVYGTVQGTAFDDENGDGQQQTSDPGLSAWTVQLLNASGQVVATTQTASDGGYSFANVLPGTYTVQEVLQSGWMKTAEPSENLIVDPGLTSTANFGNFQLINISGIAFDDANGDGVQQPYEAGIPGITVQLYTESNGQVSANPIQMTTTDPNGKYAFTNLGALPAGTSYVVGEVVPADTNETLPTSSSNTIALPNGSIGYIVPAIGGVQLDVNGQPSISGTGSYTFNSLADNVTGAISFNDGQGNSGSGIEAYISPFNFTFNNGVNAPVSFTSFCIDLTHEINVGGTYPVAVQTDEAAAYANGNRMAYIEQMFGRGNISTDQAVAVQIALWDLSLNNHNPTYFKQDGSVYDSGDPSVFSVANLSTSAADTAVIVQDVSQFLGLSQNIDPPGAYLGTKGTGQSVTVPNNTNNFGNQGQPNQSTPTPGGKPGQMPRQNPNAGANGPNTTGPCAGPVRPGTGTNDPSVDLFDAGGQDPMSLVVSWINGNYSAGSNMGSRMNSSLAPSAVRIGSTNTLAIVIGGDDALIFDWNGSNYVERFGGHDLLTYNPSTLQYTLVDSMGDQFVFWGFDPSVPALQRGNFQSMTDPGGNVTQVTSRNADGEMLDVQRSSSGLTESFLYTYVSSGVDAGLVQNITWRRSTDGGNTWSTVRQAVFSYYDGTQPYGNVGDLEFLNLEDASGNLLGTSYFRYYTPADAGTVGYVHGLKYFFSEQSYARLAANLGEPTTATDFQVSPYADDYLQYSQDPLHFITQEVVQGEGCSSCSAGLGTFSYTYTFSNNPVGYNSWYVKTVETHPDGSVETIYSNAYSEIMLDSFTDATTGITTTTYYRYDNNGYVILMANPSAVLGYDDSFADLVNHQNGAFQYLSASSGLINLTDYYSGTSATETTPGGVAGYVQDAKIAHGYQSTPILQASMTYFLHTGGGVTYTPPATSTVYRNDDGTGAETTSYAYTWYANSVQMQSMTTTLPVISAAQNGPGVADQSVSFFDRFGHDVWDKDGDGYINYTEYDPATGAVVESIQDVNTANTSDFQNLPAGWQTPPGGGLNLVTLDDVDPLGRTVEEVSPKGNITYTTYDDVNHETRTYVGWNSTTGTPTGPTQVFREDWANGYTETLTMSAAPHLTDGVPDGTEPIADVQTLSRFCTNPAGQVVREDDYFNVAGLAYSTALYIGAANVNYYTRTLGYDDAGRLDHVQTPTGTITDQVFDGRGDVLSTWVGTNDTPADGQEWSPTDNTAPSNMVEVSANVYDNGGVGDDNLTQTTQFPGGSEAPHVIQYYFDWRDRQVAEKDGVQVTEADGTNRSIYFTTFDNLGEAIAQAMYTGDCVTIQTVNGVPQAPDPSLLRAYSTSEFDDQGRVYKTNTFDVNPTTGTVSTSSLTTNFYYDHRGDLIATSAPGGLWTKDVFDGARRKTVEYTTDGGNGATWAGASTIANDTVLEQVETVFDPNSNPVETIDAQRLPNATGTGALGTPTSGVAARVYYSGMYYDLADRPIADVNVGTNAGTAWVMPSTVPDRSDTVLVTSFGYSAAGFQNVTTDPMGYVDFQQEDALGRVMEDIQDYTDGIPTNDSNRITQYTYDGDNNVLTVTAVQPSGTPSQTTQYVYGVTTAGGSAINSNDLLAATLYPDKTTGQPSAGEEETYTTNALGQVHTYTDRNGNMHVYGYDVLGRLISDTVQVLGDGVDGSIRRIDTAYDQQGNAYLFTSYADTAGTQIVNQVLRQFNGLGQMTAEYQSVNGPVDLSSTPSVQYNYTEMAGGQNNSRLLSMTYPNGRVLSFNYNFGLDDTISRLSSISDSSGILEAYRYLGLNTVVERDHPETGVKETFISPTGVTGAAGDDITGLDEFGRIVEDAYYNAVTQTYTDDFKYAFDRDSNVTIKDNQINSAFNEAYAYNGLNELTGYTRANGDSQGYGLDALGNFTSVVTNGVTQTRTANAQNEYATVSGSVMPTYDNNGNLTTDPTTGNKFTYDAWNRLVQVGSSSGTVLASYQYDATGRRVVETTNGTSSDLYHSSRWQVVEERVNGQTTAQNVWSPLGVDKLVCRDTNPDCNGNPAQRIYVQQDTVGNVTAALNAGGLVLARFAYTPFGEQTVYDPNWNTLSLSPVDLPYGFHAYRGDVGLGLDDARVRAYIIGLGRFAQNDPMGLNGGSANYYEFANNSPPNKIDPFGLLVPVPPPALVFTPHGLIIGGLALVIGESVQLYQAFSDIAAAEQEGALLDQRLQQLEEARAQRPPVPQCRPRKPPKPQKGCKPCNPPVGTISFRLDVVPPSRPHPPFPGSHVHLFVMMQSPHPVCKCFWHEFSVIQPPPPPGAVPITPASGGGPA